MHIPEHVLCEIFSYIPWKIQLLFVNKQFKKIFCETILKHQCPPVFKYMEAHLYLEYVSHDICLSEISCHLNKEEAELKFDLPTYEGCPFMIFPECYKDLVEHSINTTSNLNDYRGEIDGDYHIFHNAFRIPCPPDCPGAPGWEKEPRQHEFYGYIGERCKLPKITIRKMKIIFKYGPSHQSLNVNEKFLRKLEIKSAQTKGIH